MRKRDSANSRGPSKVRARSTMTFRTNILIYLHRITPHLSNISCCLRSRPIRLFHHGVIFILSQSVLALITTTTTLGLDDIVYFDSEGKWCCASR